MRKHRLVYLAFSSSLLLAGCSLSSVLSPGNSEEYFRIDLYTDYEGIEQDIASKSLNASSARLVGYCYAKKNQAMNIDGMAVAEGAPQYNKSTRTASEGYHYSFKEWVGFYDDGSAIDQSKIAANCKLFASFEALKNEYTVTFSNQYQQLWSERFLYQETIGGSEVALKNNDFVHDPENRGGDLYYLDYVFDGYEITSLDDDGKVVSTTKADSFEGVNAYVITGDTNIKVHYAGTTDASGKFKEGTKKSFSVRVSPVDENGNALAFDDGSNSVIVPILYDEGIAESNLGKTVAGKQFVRFEGAYDASDASLPKSLIDESVNPVSGKPFDANHVRYNVSVKAIYADIKKSVTVNFHEKADPSILTFEEGDALTWPKNNIELPDGMSFAGYYVAEKDSLDPFDVSSLYSAATLDLYPAAVPTRIQDHIGNKAFYYRFDLEQGGYVLENFALLSGDNLDEGKTTIDIVASDFLSNDHTSSTGVSADVLNRFGFIAIESMKAVKSSGAPGTSVNRIQSIAFPSGMSKILDSGLDGLSKLCYEPGSKVLDLSSTSIDTIGSYAFKDAINVEKIILPSSIQEIGSYAFKGCENLNEIVLPEGKAKTDFSENWNYKNVGEEIAVSVAGE